MTATRSVKVTIVLTQAEAAALDDYAERCQRSRSSAGRILITTAPAIGPLLRRAQKETPS